MGFLLHIENKRESSWVSSTQATNYNKFDWNYVQWSFRRDTPDPQEMSRFYQINNVNLSQCSAKHYTITPQKQINTFESESFTLWTANNLYLILILHWLIFVKSYFFLHTKNLLLSKYKLYRNDFLSKNILSLIFLTLKIIVIRSKNKATVYRIFSFNVSFS